MVAECDAFLEAIEHRASGSQEPHELCDIGLPVRVQSALRRSGVLNVRQLCERTQRQIENTTGIGRHGVAAIQQALDAHGYALREETCDHEETLANFRAQLDEWGSTETEA
jgi:DNA-directed RNA polymerase alpha subunit